MSLQQLSNLLPLPAEDLQQVLSYAESLSKEEAADHFTNLLGASPQSIEFISSFNAKRQDPTSSSKAPAASESYSGVPKPKPKGPRKKAPLHTPAPRKVDDSYAAPGTAYKKKDEDDYVVKKPAAQKAAASSSTNASTPSAKPAATQAPTPRAPPSAAGTLISDTLSVPSKSSRTSSPAPKTKVNITGGTSMHGASTALSELDAAIRALEISTNSSLQDNKKRACNCIATRHPLLTAAPNCLNCGKVICVKEGLGPCTFCGTPLLSAVEVQSMITSLRSERGREKMALDNASNRRAAISTKPLPFTQAKNPDMSPAELKAKEHRDRLLGFQAQNAKRTTVRDEAADFDDVADVGKGALWMSPAQRAKEVKRLQKVMGEREWNARPEYEKRRQVVSLDLVGGRIKKTVKMAAVERPEFASDSEPEIEEREVLGESTGNSGGTFARNPLLAASGLIKPIWRPQEGKGKERAVGEEENVEQGRKKMWRRVQDDLDDNEAVILDGGALGGVGVDSGREEPDCG